MRDILLQIEPQIPGLRRYARALMRDRAAADDLVQACLERAVATWHRRRKDREPRSWLFAILHNLAVNRLRQMQRQERQGAAEPGLDQAFAPRLMHGEASQQRDLLEALARLPEEQRSVILLVAVEDFTYAETAEVLAVPMGTVMSRLARGREKLRRLLDRDATVPGIRSRRRPYLRRVK